MYYTDSIGKDLEERKWIMLTWKPLIGKPLLTPLKDVYSVCM